MSSRAETIAELRKEVKQLRREAKAKRMKISQSAGDLMSYCRRHAKDDYLLKGRNFGNRYKEESSCNVM